MFKFQTTTLLNNFVDDNGVNKIVSDANSLTIHRLGKFEKANVTKIYKRTGTNGTPGSAEITCVVSDVPSVGTALSFVKRNAGIYRLNLYVRLSGNNDPMYSNVYVFKGKPYSYEFEVKGATVTAEDVAKAAKAAIDKQASRFSDLVFNVVRDGAKLTITTNSVDNVYHNITVCDLQKFDVTVASALVGGEYVDIAEGEMTPCVNPFGNYTEIIKDLRLPTVEHTSWTSPQQAEMPVLGTVYNQYMIYMCKDRGVMGGDAVGEVTKSVTSHSIWVPQALATEFEGYLANIGTVENYKA